MPLIRSCRVQDLPAVTQIYAHHVHHSTGSFDTEPPSEAQMRERYDEVLGRGLPWLVVEDGGQIVGFAYCNWFRPRAAYRFSAEDSIYLAPHAKGAGLGRALLAELCRRAELAGVRKMIAAIGDSSNTASIGAHRANGFSHAGVLTSAGWKFGRWLDVVLMEKSLGLGDSTPPEPAP